MKQPGSRLPPLSRKTGRACRIAMSPRGPYGAGGVGGAADALAAPTPVSAASDAVAASARRTPYLVAMVVLSVGLWGVNPRMSRKAPRRARGYKPVPTRALLSP